MPTYPGAESTLQTVSSVVGLGCEVRECGCYEPWVVTHREVIAARYLDLLGVGVICAPAFLEPQRIIELTEDRQQRPIRKSLAQPRIQLRVEVIGVTGAAEVAVPSASRGHVDGRPKYRHI